MRRLFLQIRPNQNFVRPVSTDAWHLGGCREAHKGGKSTSSEDAQKAIAGGEKKRRRRIANARLRAWTANKDLISYISDDFERGQTLRNRPISAEETWRRNLGKLLARQSSRKANRGWAKYRQQQSNPGGEASMCGDDWYERPCHQEESQSRSRRGEHAVHQKEQSERDAEMRRSYDRMMEGFDAWGRAAFETNCSERSGGYGSGAADQHRAASQLRPRHSPSVLQHLQALGLSAHEAFDAAGLKAAFHSSAKLYHPDRHCEDRKANAEAIFKRMQEAYIALISHLKDIMPY